MSHDSAAFEYDDALRALAERGRFGIRLGLGRTRALLRRDWATRSARPRRAGRRARTAREACWPWPAARCGPAGLRVGETPKPHLVTYRERIEIDGRPIDAATFARLVADVLPVADRVARRHGEPTEFELLTAVVFRHFADAHLDVALVEVGLGGRLDATHAWDGGVAAITNVDLDHTDRLGPTIAAIAREKAAIIERGDLAVTGATGEALAVIRRRARRLGVPLDRGVAGPAPRSGSRRDRRRAAVARAHPRRAAGPPPGRERGGRRRGARRPRGRRDRQRRRRRAAVRLRGRDVARPARAAPRERARRPARRGPQPGRCGGARRRPRRPPAVPRRRADHARDRHDVGQGRRWGDRGAVGRVAAMAGAPDRHDRGGLAAGDASGRARRALGRGQARTSRDRCAVAADPVTALELALAEGDGPVVVAGSLYLVGAVRAVLVDDPDLRDPRPRQARGPMTTSSVHDDRTRRPPASAARCSPGVRARS